MIQLLLDRLFSEAGLRLPLRLVSLPDPVPVFAVLSLAISGKSGDAMSMSGIALPKPPNKMHKLEGLTYKQPWSPQNFTTLTRWGAWRGLLGR